MSEKTELLQRMSDDVFEMDDEDIIPEIGRAHV